MAWENIEVTSIEEVRDIRLDIEAAKVDMEERIKEIKKNIRGSETYERWANNLENGVNEIIQVFFSVLDTDRRITKMSMTRIPWIFLEFDDVEYKKLHEVRKKCEEIIIEECEFYEVCFMKKEAEIHRVLIKEKSIFKMFTKAIIWIVDEAYDKTKCMGINHEKFFSLIRKKIVRYCKTFFFKEGVTKLGATKISRIIECLDESIIEQSINSFLSRQESWEKMKNQILTR